MVPRSLLPLVLAAVLAGAPARASGALLTEGLGELAAEIETRLKTEADPKRKKVLKQALQALRGPKAASYVGDAAALKALLAKLPKLRLDAADPLAVRVDAALSRLRAEWSGDYNRLFHQMIAKGDPALEEVVRKALRESRDALDKASDEELPLTARAAALRKAFALLAAGRKRLRVVGTSVCDSGGRMEALADGEPIAPLSTSGERHVDGTGATTYMNVVSLSQDPGDPFFGYSRALSVVFRTSSFQGVGTYAVTRDGPVRASVVVERWIEPAVEGSVVVTAWDPGAGRAEGTFSFRAEKRDGGSIDVTQGTFTACRVRLYEDGYTGE